MVPASEVSDRSSGFRTALGALLFVAQAPAAPEAIAWEQLTGLDRVVRILRDSREPGAAGPDVLVDRLGDPVREELDGVLGLMLAGELPGLAEGEAPQRLSEPQTELLAGALRRAGRTAVLPRLEAALAGRRDLDVRQLEIEVLGAIGGGYDLARVLAGALHAGETKLDSSVERRARRAVASILRNDPGGHQFLLESWRLFQLPLLPLVIAAVGDAGDPRGVELMESIATWEPRVAEEAIAQVRKLGRSPSDLVNRNMILTARRYLDTERPDRCQNVILALGELGDEESIPTFLRMLENSSKGARQSIVWSLRRMSGMAFDDSVRLWRRWYAEEQAWSLERRQRLFEDLQSANRALVTAALKEISRRRLDRDGLALALAQELTWLPADLWPFACHVLGQLGSLRAAPALVELLAEPDGELAEASRAALRRITGVDHGLDPGAWRACLRL